MSNIIIIGGGASGLVAAIYAARNNNTVTILEHKDKIGKKLLATGNGKCNYTNRNQKAEHYRGNDISFAMKVLSGFGVEQTIDLFKELGIYPKEKNGYVYPNSEQASSVVEVLRLELLQLKVRIITETHVKQIVKQTDQFQVITDKDSYLADQVILAAGGCASPNLGSDGSGYQLAKSLGHRVIKPLPALVQLKSGSKYFKTLSGVRTEAQIALYINDMLAVKEQGELLLAAYGLSGIPVLQISRFASKALSENKKVHLVIDYLPHMTFEEAYKLISSRITRNPYRTVEENLIGLLNNKLIFVGLKEAGVEPTKLSNSVNKNQINDLVKQLKGWRVIITEPNSFEQAQVSAGGVDTTEINPETLESKLIKGLYITGEIIDVDGTCGGYNLQWAWSTGVLAGMNCGMK
ncbi:NAD(P)/FAD-dependent oxidoreductase [Anaerocolumna sp. MB42-C2]|uniref:NAD(P)/FAD-dependent oxidoreductase n=1 Tax=Anaerocolumna sp. MB42-C2 TaxID=3070997 RepID=UPI0027DEF5C0|nr:NAD(P)/FAD-dependent oxidoreductase [Anaerocolumna sp. MB42-C2]WMJ88067.1 NAD(P)/FAD-dependent oxidoreductase [Anaerocolumna sp. MB42-C2]